MPGLICVWCGRILWGSRLYWTLSARTWRRWCGGRLMHRGAKFSLKKKRGFNAQHQCTLKGNSTWVALLICGSRAQRNWLGGQVADYRTDIISTSYAATSPSDVDFSPELRRTFVTPRLMQLTWNERPSGVLLLCNRPQSLTHDDATLSAAFGYLISNHEHKNEGSGWPISVSHVLMLYAKICCGK